jgi:APA family basic amino acid/polyamine antiporter
VLAILASFLMTLPVALDLIGQVRRGEWLPASLLTLYVVLGLAIYLFYGKPQAARRLAAATAAAPSAS